ncbi:MAG: hypothetical protein HC777_00105 [Hyphomonadaceae bacterium]|nr:hypothetical protein [Hyphomonadaceae bacterium]
MLPKGEVKAGFRSFTLNLANRNFDADSAEIIAKYLDRDEISEISKSSVRLLEQRPEDYIVSGLIDFPDVAYEENADLLYDLASQVVQHVSKREI